MARYKGKLMNTPALCNKGNELISMYENMAEAGYERTDKVRIESAFNDFEIRVYKSVIRNIIESYNFNTILDYGCGGSDWDVPNFDEETNQSAVEYFNLDKVYKYEPARNIDERQKVDCVISFDVLEHIFIADIPSVIRDMFSYANKMLLVNVACYPAKAKLPNGENAHITVRQPSWWKGIFDCIATEFPHVEVCLICSPAWRKSETFPLWSGKGWLESETFVITN